MIDVEVESVDLIQIASYVQYLVSMPIIKFPDRCLLHTVVVL